MALIFHGVQFYLIAVEDVPGFRVARLRSRAPGRA